MTKKLISLLLVISMLCSTLPVLALEETPALDLNNSINNTETVIDTENLPAIVMTDSGSVPLINNVSLYNNAEISMPVTSTMTPKIEMSECDTIELPPNKTEADDGGWVSANEIDEEDLIALENEAAEKAAEIESIDEINKSNISTMSTRTSSSSPFDSAYRISNINSKDALALQNQTGRTNFIGDNIGEEYIDPLTGNLIVTETDLTLPGVDGLDLNLSRYYSLAQAELYTKSAGIVTTPTTFVLQEGMYVVTEEVYNTETNQTSTYYYPYFTQEDADLRVEEITSRDTCDGLYMYSATWDISSEGDTVTLDYYYTSEITASNYQRMRNDLGTGWSWSFPSVQTIKADYEDENEMPSALYYHDGKGNVLEVKYDNLNGCWFENYVGGDITFEIAYYYDTSIVSSTRIDYIVEDSDGTGYYFGPHGEIRTIMDMYGNKITFNYYDKDFYGLEDMPVISSITDTVGRTIRFYYDEDGDYEIITVRVTSPFESERNLELSYKKKMIDITTSKEIKDEDGDVIEVETEYISTEPFLESFTNALGETTSYYPAWMDGERKYAHPVLFTFADKKINSDFVYNTGGYTNNLVYLLGNIVRPHSNTYYYYDLCERNLGHSGISEAYRVDERGDDLLVVDSNDNIIDGYSNNVIEYTYSRDYTGYPFYNSVESIDADDYVCRTKEIRENATYTREFYKKDEAVLKQDEEITYANPVGNNLKVTHHAEDFWYKQPIMTKITYDNGAGYTYDSYVYSEISTDYDKSFGKPLIATEELDFETVFHADRQKHAMLYTYDGDTGFVLTKAWYKSDSSKCTEYYTYDSNDRLASVRLADGTTTTYAYEYTNGHVSKVTATTPNDTGTTVVEEIYTSATAYSLPSSVTKTVTDGENTKSQTTTYTYDMLLGVVKTQTDNDGNVTYYEYDNLGRPTRIVYPKYSTYSAYGAKDVSILPVENITYGREWREYDDVSNGDELGSQVIVTTLNYYDMTDSTLTYPTDEELADYSKVYYGAQINYYLGTGELIESMMLDTIEGVNEFATTTYYYDTAENTIMVVNPKGERTVTQYDGMGREVKVTDAFDNNHIVEYNISSDGVGFKAQSYFVPADDADTKENIVDYKYDRLQRLVSEKAYSSYPDTASEIQYTYDFVGNMIGMIDANENLNSDGYTQTNTYNKLNRLTSSKNAYNEILRNTYDSAGNIKKQTITDSSGTESILYQRSYDGEGKIISDTDNADNSNTYHYNNLGQLVQSVDKDSKMYNAEYNALGMQDAETHVKPQELMTARNYSITNPYGAATVFDLRGVYVEDSGNYGVYDTQTAQYSYSQTGKLLTQMTTYGYRTGIDADFISYIHYTYDSAGNVTSALHGTVDHTNQTIHGAITYYEYDKSRVVKVQVDGDTEKNTSASSNVQYEYYSDGKLKSITYPTLTDNTVLKTEYVYDDASRLTSLTNYKGTSVLSSYAYTYDSNGNILTTTETFGETQNTASYTYDKLNRISTVSGTKGVDSYYEYDSRGNRKANYEQIDFLSEENAEFRYDEEDRLYYANVGNDTTSFEYSSNGYRYVKRENTSYPEFYIYDEQGRLHAIAKPVTLAMNDGTEVATMFPTVHYIWGPDRVLAKVDKITGQRYYYLYNGHYDVVQIVDISGNIVNQYDYDVWGNFITKQETIDNHFTYFGQTYDETTGLYYLRARYYDPTTGRFTQQDSAEDGYNWYVYGNQNPMQYADWDGKFATAAAAGIAATEVLKYVAAIAGGVAIGNGIVYFAKGGKQNKRSSEFQNVSDAELEEMYKDPNTSKAQKQKIKTEQKARKTRHSSQKK